MKMKKTLVGMGLALALFATGCSASGDNNNSGGGSGDGAVLTVGMPNGSQTNNQNPFMGTSSALSLGYAYAMYEPLVQVNLVDPTTEPEPWLASAFSWNDDFTEVTFTARDGVKWSDGTDFTAKDIEFSFNLLKEFPALNSNALPFGDVTVDGSDVTVGFERSQFVNQSKVLNLIVVPEHIWSAIDDPTTDVNNDPIGTGPYVLSSWTPQAAILDRNENYWGGTPEAPQLRYSSYNDNNALTTALASGEVQWGWTFIADFENVYINKDPDHNNFWAPAGLGLDVLYLNTTEKPFDDPAVRKALNMVVDRAAVQKQATSGVFPELKNIAGMPLPVGDSYLAPEFKGVDYKVDVDGAKKVLADAGYTLNGDKLVDPDGTAVTFTLTNPAGWNDYLTTLQLVSDSAKLLGIDATVDAANVDTWTDDLAKGKFQASLHWTDTGATPWDMYSNITDGAQLVDIGEKANWNFGRYDNKDITEKLSTFATSSDESVRQAAIEDVQRIFVEDVPAIPTVTRPFAAQFSTKNYTGWPDEQNPYNTPQPTGTQASQILMKLKAVK